MLHIAFWVDFVLFNDDRHPHPAMGGQGTTFVCLSVQQSVIHPSAVH